MWIILEQNIQGLINVHTRALKEATKPFCRIAFRSASQVLMWDCRKVGLLVYLLLLVPVDS